MPDPRIATCPDCSGIGYDGTVRCPVCDGACKVEECRDHEQNIERGRFIATPYRGWSGFRIVLVPQLG